MKHRRTRPAIGAAASAVLGVAATLAPAVLPVGGVAIATAALDTAAQAPTESLKPPSVNETDDPPTIRMYLVATLLGALVVSANLIPSKRGHQD